MKSGHLDENNIEKNLPPSLEKDVFTSRKHGMDYFTRDGVVLRTGYKNMRDWYLLPIREIMDNGADFLWKHYKGAKNACISVNVTMDDELFRIIVRNSNDKNIPVLAELAPIFDYDMRYGSKQDVHIISRGMLGDAMKQILSLGYVLLHTSDDGIAFTDKQWEHPLIIRHNKKEWRIYLRVDKARQVGQVRIEESTEEIAYTDTEIELMLPMIDEDRNNLNRKYIEQFLRKYSIFTTDISFKFHIADDITTEPVDYDDACSEKILSIMANKGTVNIDFPALHPTTMEREWSNSNSIHSYKPDEFIRRITNVHDKDSTSVYDELLSYSREGSNVKKTAENLMSVAELLSKPDKDKRIEALYHELKKMRDPPAELSLPYTTNTKKRTVALVSRIAKLYEIDKEKEPSYKLNRGFYQSEFVQYPYAFEILAIPFKNPIGPPLKSTEIIAAVNYSVSPRENTFEGDYFWYGKNGFRNRAKNIRELLEKHGFHTYSAPTSKLPSIIVANLITPRRDPQGFDKSSIDTQPFTQTITTAVNKMASGVQTYRAAGYRFQKADDYSTGRQHDTNTQVSARELLKQFLIKERGLPGG
jgi:hypothetical protein